ncbi:MAG: hypothetical protein ABH821_05640 [archaeon]
MLNEKLLELLKKKTFNYPLIGFSETQRMQEFIVKIIPDESLSVKELEVLTLSNYCHNLGLPFYFKYKQNLIDWSLAETKKFLLTNNFNNETINKVLHCVKEHSITGSPQTTEAMILQDVFLLDEISNLSLLKTVYHSSILGENEKQLLSRLKGKEKFFSQHDFNTVQAKKLSSNLESFLEQTRKTIQLFEFNS